MDYPSDPKVGLVGGKFTDGDPANGVPASLDPASHLNAITDELLNAISEAGLTPAEADLTQLKQALRILGKPAGEVFAWPVATPPAGSLECNGAAISRITYADLFTAIGTTFGGGDGSTTFNLPDLRGEFLRGWDNGRGVDAGRGIASAQGDDFLSHKHTVHVYGPSNSGGTNVAASLAIGGSYNSATTPTIDEGQTYMTGGTETRPRNIALMFCIKY